jgi:hypothetical protein
VRTRNVVILVAFALLVVGFLTVRQLGDSEAARRARLLPQVRSAFDGLRNELSAVHGIELILVSTRRTQAEQDAKVAAGLSAAKDSWHLLGRALDVQTARRNKEGKLIADPLGDDVVSYQRLHEVAKGYGFRGVPNGSPFTGDGKKAYISTSSGKVWDVFHLEYAERFKTVAEARKADQKVGLA